MPFTPAFSVSSLLGNPAIVVLNDESTGSDPNIVEKHVYLTKSDGTYLTPEGSTTDYIVWPTATNPLYLDILDKDYALNVSVEWSDNVDNGLLINSTDFFLINSTSTDKILI